MCRKKDKKSRYSRELLPRILESMVRIDPALASLHATLLRLQQGRNKKRLSPRGGEPMAALLATGGGQRSTAWPAVQAVAEALHRCRGCLPTGGIPRRYRPANCPICPWKKSSMPFFHSVDRWKSRGFLRSTGIASSDAALYPQTAIPGSSGGRDVFSDAVWRKKGSPGDYSQLPHCPFRRTSVTTRFAAAPLPAVLGVPRRSAAAWPAAVVGGCLGVIETLTSSKQETSPQVRQTKWGCSAAASPSFPRLWNSNRQT